MEEKNKKKKWYLNLFNGHVFAVAFLLEIFEEVLEELFATGVSMLIGKAISVLFVVTITQVTKLSIKRFIKIFTYKEGHDKMKLFKKIGESLKNVWTFVWNNKFSEIGVAMACSFGYMGYVAFTKFVLANMFFGIVVGLVVAVLSILVINKASWETLTQIKTRLSDKLLTKEEKAKAREFEKKVEETARKLQREQFAQLEERAKQIVIQEQRQNVGTQK